jgi:phage-related protein
MAKLESLIVDMQLQFAELHKGLEAVKSELKETAKATEGLLSFEVFKEVGKLAFEAAEKLADFALQGGEVADRTAKMAAAAQVSVEEFARLSYTAKLSGSSAEEVGGVARGSGEIFRELAGKLNDLAPGYAKADLEQQLFGKSGTALDALLKDVAGGMADAGGEADDYAKAIAAAAGPATEFNDNIGRLKLASDTVAISLAAKLAPALKELSDQFLSSSEKANTMRETVDVLATALKVFATVAVTVKGFIVVLGEAIGGVAAALMTLQTGNLAGAKEGVEGLFKDLAKSSKDTGKELSAIWTTSTVEIKKHEEAVKKDGDETVKRAHDGAKALTEMAQAQKSVTKLVEEYQLKVAGFGKGALATLLLDIDLGPLSEQFKRLGDSADAFRSKLVAAVIQLERLQIAKVLSNAGFESGREQTALRIDSNQRRLAYDSVADTAKGQANYATAGFASFDDALAEMAKQTKIRSEALATVEIAKIRKDEDTAREFTLVADQAQLAAGHASKAADGFQTLAEISIREAQEAAQQIGQAFQAIGKQLTKNLGDLGNVIEDAISGAQSGGVWGAIVAVVIDLFARFERFGEILAKGEQQIGDVIDQLQEAFGGLADGFLSFMSALDPLNRIISGLISGPLRSIGQMLEHLGLVLGPIFELLEVTLEPIFHIVDFIFDLIGNFDVVGYALKALGAVIRIFSIAILGVELGIEKAVYYILEGIRDALAKMGFNTEALAVSAVEGKVDEARAATEAKLNAAWNEVTHTFDDKVATNLDTGLAPVKVGSDDLGDSLSKTAKAANKLTEAFTNMPAGFRVPARTFQATTPGPLGGPNGDVIHIHVAGSLLSEKQLQQQIKDAQNRQTFRKLGLGGNS